MCHCNMCKIVFKSLLSCLLLCIGALLVLAHAAGTDCASNQFLWCGKPHFGDVGTGLLVIGSVLCVI